MAKQFRITADHLKLMRRMNVDWCGDEFGAPSIDPKRPYGNSSVIQDIAEIVGVDIPEESTPASQLLEERLSSLHRETKRALQVVLSAGTFAEGLYQADEYRNNWTRIAD